MNRSTRQFAEEFHCKYTVFEKGTDPRAVELAYMAALEVGKLNGFCPAILSLDEYALEWLEDIASEEYDREKIIAGCENNGKELLKERFEESFEDFEGDVEEMLADFIGEETEGEVLHHFTGYRSFTHEGLEADTLLLELPVKNPWEIIGYLPMGGWNECPAPEEMIAVCKYWYETYRAIPAVFSHDTMEFYAPFKLNLADPLEAAKEHYAFCTDRVYQGTETCKLSELAAGLRESEVWFFWWD